MPPLPPARNRDSDREKSIPQTSSRGHTAMYRLLQFAFAHMLRVDGACHHIPHGTRHWICWLRRASTGGLYFLLVVFCIMCMTSLQRLQVLYQFSSTNLWLLVIGPALEEINPKLNPKTASEVDELLATEVGMYVCPPQFLKVRT